MTNLGVHGNINDCRINSLKVPPALHWLAKQGPVTEGHQRRANVLSSFGSLPIHVYETYLPAVLPWLGDGKA
jgi:hypothetical protein